MFRCTVYNKAGVRVRDILEHVSLLLGKGIGLDGGSDGCAQAGYTVEYYDFLHNRRMSGNEQQPNESSTMAAANMMFNTCELLEQIVA